MQGKSKGSSYYIQGVAAASKDSSMAQIQLREGYGQPKIKSLEGNQWNLNKKTMNKDKHPHFLDNGQFNSKQYFDRVGKLLERIDGERNSLSGSMINVAATTSNGSKALKQTMHTQSQSSVLSSGIRLKSIEASSSVIGEENDDYSINRKNLQIISRKNKRSSDFDIKKGNEKMNIQINVPFQQHQQRLHKIATVGGGLINKPSGGNKHQSQQIHYSSSQIRLATSSDASASARRLFGYLGNNEEKQLNYPYGSVQTEQTEAIDPTQDKLEEYEYISSTKNIASTENINTSTLDSPTNVTNVITNQNTHHAVFYKNNYTSSDSRFEVISNLKIKCAQQQRIIDELQGEIVNVDEFKIVMEAQITRQYEDIRQYGEKRIMLLQGQLKKQQRHIRKLNTLLSTARKTLSEVLEITRLLVDGVNKSADGESFLNQTQITNNFNQLQQQYSNSSRNTGIDGNQGSSLQTQSSRQMGGGGGNSNLNSHNRQASQESFNERMMFQKKTESIIPKTSQVENKIMNSKEDEDISQQNPNEIANLQLDKQNPHKKTEKDLPELLSQMTQQQALKKVYEALMEVSDRQSFVNNFNELYKKVSEFESNSEEFKKLFFIQKKHGKQSLKVKFQHPIRVIFENFPNCFPVPTLFSILDPSSKQALLTRIFALMGVLKSTQRAFSRIRTFQLFSHNPIYFEDTEKAVGNVTIPTLLLENKQQFEEFLQPRGSARMLSLDFNKIMATDISLGLLLDRLLGFFGYLNSKGENTQEIAELMDKLRQGCEDLLCLGIVTPHEQGNLTSQRITLISEKKSQINEKNYQQIKNSNSNLTKNDLEWVDYDKSMDMHADFNEKKMTLNGLFDELCQAKDTKDRHEITQKIGTVLGSFSVIFETKENQIKLKDIEISYLRNLVSLQKQEGVFVQEFISAMQSSINEFLTPVNQKMSAVVSNFNALFEGQTILDATSRKSYSNAFKRNTKEMLELLKRILTNSCPTNKINILTLQQQFDERVQQVAQLTNQLNPAKQKGFYL